LIFTVLHIYYTLTDKGIFVHTHTHTNTHTHTHTGVFQPGYNLPTMSLDEYAQQQMAEAQARADAQTHAQAEGGGGGPPRRYKQLEEEGKEDEEGLVEEAVYADRAWDAFKDEHPFGSGNKAGKLF
jgi:hypothetical protein